MEIKDTPCFQLYQICFQYYLQSAQNVLLHFTLSAYEASITRYLNIACVWSHLAELASICSIFEVNCKEVNFDIKNWMYHVPRVKDQFDG